MTEPRKHDPRWKDATRAARQRRRQAALDAAAQAAGFATWARLETAIVNGASVTVTPAPCYNTTLTTEDG